jgi:CRISPR/Cas system-associated protein Csm6
MGHPILAPHLLNNAEEAAKTAASSFAASFVSDYLCAGCAAVWCTGAAAGLFALGRITTPSFMMI